MAGYSGTPLGKKLGIRPGITLHVVNAPCDYSAVVAPLPEGTVIALTGTQDLDFVHIFATSRSDLTASLNDFRRKIKQNGVIWVSWPKRHPVFLRKSTRAPSVRFCASARVG